ncbi:hypothetical protein FSP39_012151 [Pinctada imbricata]|uniref:DUF4590 domain-containing protein n=1 Tax=Pinctada imbricata TaxID=66713 RepID=A0AA88XM30_PINIB|nr:hypothetical protein FSP39_012151 [Pinctada imbricata]
MGHTAEDVNHCLRMDTDDDDVTLKYHFIMGCGYRRNSKLLKASKPLATYSSLTDKNLAGYFANTRMRKHLKKAGLVNKRGELVSENQYRLSMARKEHKKHVKNLLAQAIVHKSLDLERTRQVEIRRKLEEIAKIELVRRVRASEKRSNDAFLLPLVTYKKPPSPPPPPTPSATPGRRRRFRNRKSCVASRGRKGDEEILPYLSPRESRAASRPATASEVRYRPQSAPAPAREAPSEYEETNVIYVDEHGRRLSPDRRDQERPQRGRPEEIDTKHLYSLDSTALKKYALQLARIDQGEVSPYLMSPVPTPPRSSRGSRSGMVGQRLRVRPRTAEARSPYRERPSSGQVQSVSGSSKSSEISPKSTPKGTPRRRFQQQRFVEGTLMLHRQEPAMMHQGEVQTLCEITMKYHGPNLTLPRDQRDPTQAVSIDQQHCGGNTLTVFKENLQPADTFSFISRRHRGFPFSLSIFVDGRIDCRISTCCEYRHAKGVKLGGKMGHFSLLKVKGATPCYKCKLNSQASPRSLKRPPTFKKDKGQPEQMQEEVIVVDKRSVTVTQDEEVEEDQNIEIPVEDDPEKGKVKHDTYIEPENDLDLGSQNDEKSNKEAKSDAKRSKQRVAKRDIVVSTTKANDSEDKYESDFEDEEDTKKENEIKGGNFEDDLSAEASKTTGNSSQDGVEEGSPLRTSTPLSKDCTPVVDWDEENDEPVVKRRESDTTNRAGKQVRFDVKVQKMGTPETSESNRNGDNDDTVGKVEPLYKDSDDKLMKGAERTLR